MSKARFRIFVAVLVIIAVFYVIRQERSRDTNPAALLARVQRLNQLTTVKYTIQQVVGLEEQKQPVGSESILLILQASVQGGVDLASMRQGDISTRADGAVVIRLPPAAILNITVDEKATKVWDRNKTWWTPWVPYSLGLEQSARQAGIESVKRAALEMGILNQAEGNAEIAIRELLTLAGIKLVVIIPAGAS